MTDETDTEPDWHNQDSGNALTDEEREFLSHARGSILAALAGEATPISDAHRQVTEVVARLNEAIPNRAARLVLARHLAEEFAKMRDDLLDDIIDAMTYGPVWNDAQKTDEGRVWKAEGWSGLGIQSWETDWLAECSGYTRQTIRERTKRWWKAAIARAEERRPKPDPNATE